MCSEKQQTLLKPSHVLKECQQALRLTYADLRNITTTVVSLEPQRALTKANCVPGSTQSNQQDKKYLKSTKRQWWPTNGNQSNWSHEEYPKVLRTTNRWQDQIWTLVEKLRTTRKPRQHSKSPCNYHKNIWLFKTHIEHTMSRFQSWSAGALCTTRGKQDHMGWQGQNQALSPYILYNISSLRKTSRSWRHYQCYWISTGSRRFS